MSPRRESDNAAGQITAIFPLQRQLAGDTMPSGQAEERPKREQEENRHGRNSSGLEASGAVFLKQMNSVPCPPL
jgi:hypothetical protein